MEFFEILKNRNEIQFWFGLFNLLLALLLILMSIVKPIEFVGTNAWYKPIKFALSIGILSWTMGWYTGYLPAGKDITIFNWIFVISLAFEIIYITLQAAKGQASHFNQSTPLYSNLYMLMAVGASAATLCVGYIGLKFVVGEFPNLPTQYLWAIRLGILIFVIFSFEGFAMGSKLTHTVGGADGSQGLPFLNWSRVFGDLRVAHFIGMHALQVIPFLAYYLLKDTRVIVALSIVYAILSIYVLVQALQAKPFLKFLG